jgi:hypothetical protein
MKRNSRTWGRARQVRPRFRYSAAFIRRMQRLRLLSEFLPTAAENEAATAFFQQEIAAACQVPARMLFGHP